MSLAKRSQKAGMPPGSLVHVGEERFHTPKITVFDYTKQSFQEKVVSSPAACARFKKSPSVTWINLDGVHDKHIIEEFGREFGFHPLLLEDIMNTDQRLKIDDFGSYLFIVLKMVYFHPVKHSVTIEQVSVILGNNYVLTFQERSDEADVFDEIRNRIRHRKGLIRESGTDYLVYSLIDAIVDHYFLVLEKTSEHSDEIENAVLSSPKSETLRALYHLKRQLIRFRKCVWPLREIIGGLERSGSRLIKPATLPYVRDVYDHTIQLIDTIETQRDMMSGMLDIYLSSISNKLNEIMKVLTIIGTIFIPLTFVTGIYGMNFRFLPELEWRYGYFLALGVMGIVAGIMLLYFRKKKWF